ncbi:uncharacterized protein BXZ73DRAFT_8925, partial [Epithele typhae]|uniref:uncharacterized protein n=1 Tax=Epithele typhae TaxID=378194 RepID=UPI002008385C
IFALVPKQRAVTWDYQPVWVLNSNPGYMDAVDFNGVLEQGLTKYRVVVDGTDLGTNPGVGMGSTGEKVDFGMFSHKGISSTSTISVYAEDPTTKNLYLLAQW